MRRAGDQGKFDVVPIFAHRIVNNRPALQQRLLAFFRWKNDSVGSFPDGHFADVADVKIAIAIPGGGNRHAANVLIARGSNKPKIFSDFSIEIAIGDAHAGGGIQIEVADFARIRDQRYCSISTEPAVPMRVFLSTLRIFPAIAALPPLRTSTRAPRSAPRNSITVGRSPSARRSVERRR